jgi:hypothetical protein
LERKQRAYKIPQLESEHLENKQKAHKRPLSKLEAKQLKAESIHILNLRQQISSKHLTNKKSHA